MKRRQFLSGTAAMLAAGGSPVFAESGTVRLIYPYAPGSGGDTLVRLIANQITEKRGDTAIVENRTGADGRIGVRAVKMAEADGRTLLFTPFGAMCLFPTVYANLPYDPVKDFEPVSQVVTFDFGMAVGPAAPVKSLAELVTWLHAHPKSATFGMPGIGALPYFLPLRFGSMTDIKFEAISYKGAPPAVAEAMGGQIPIVSAPISDLVGQHQAGTIRVLATSGATRSPFLPDVPTFKEQGFDIEGSGWYGIFAPAKTPAATIAGLNKVVVDFMHSEAGKAQALKLGLVPTGTTSAELGAIQHRDAERWAPVIRASGFRAD